MTRFCYEFAEPDVIASFVYLRLSMVSQSMHYIAIMVNLTRNRHILDYSLDTTPTASKFLKQTTRK